MSAAEIARGKAFFAREDFTNVLRHDASAFDTAAQLRSTSNMKMMDALHYATALQAGCRFLLTNDGDCKTGNQLEAVSVSSLLGKRGFSSQYPAANVHLQTVVS